MTFTEAVITCLRRYATFKGRAPRSEYWWFALFCFLGGLAFGFLEGMINGITGTADGPTILSGAFNFATLIPSIAAGWRRMHDTGRSGLYLLYPLIVMVGMTTYIGMTIGFEPLTSDGVAFETSGITALILMIGGIAFVISPFLVLWWLTRPSQPGSNEYGPNPYGISA